MVSNRKSHSRSRSASSGASSRSRSRSRSRSHSRSPSHHTNSPQNQITIEPSQTDQTIPPNELHLEEEITNKDNIVNQVTNDQKSRSRSRTKSKSKSKSRSRSRRDRRHSRGRRSHKRRRHRSSSRSYTRSRSRGRNTRKHKGSTRNRYSNSRSRTRTRSRSPSPYYRRLNPSPCRVLGVFGLNFETDERDLRKVFEKYGRLDKVKLVTDPRTNRSRGFAFIYFANVGDAEEAKERIHGQEIDGNHVRVEYSISNREHNPTPGVYMGRRAPPSTSSRYSDRDDYSYRREGRRGGHDSRSRSRSRTRSRTRSRSYERRRRSYSRDY